MICYTLTRNYCPLRVDIQLEHDAIHNSQSIENSLQFHMDALKREWREWMEWKNAVIDTATAGNNNSNPSPAFTTATPASIYSHPAHSPHSSIPLQISATHPSNALLSGGRTLASVQSAHPYASFSRNKPRASGSGSNYSRSGNGNSNNHPSHSFTTSSIECMKTCIAKQWITSLSEEIMCVDINMATSSTKGGGTGGTGGTGGAGGAGGACWNITHRTTNANAVFQFATQLYGEYGNIQKIHLHSLVDARIGNNGEWNAVEICVQTPSPTIAQCGQPEHAWVQSMVQCVLVHIMSQKKGTSLVLNMQLLNHPLLMELVYILSSLYEKVNIVKLHPFGTGTNGDVAMTTATMLEELQEDMTAQFVRYHQCYIVCNRFQVDAKTYHVIQQLIRWNATFYATTTTMESKRGNNNSNDHGSNNHGSNNHGHDESKMTTNADAEQKETLISPKMPAPAHTHATGITFPSSRTASIVLKSLLKEPPSLYFANKWEELNAMIGQQYLEQLAQQMNHHRTKWMQTNSNLLSFRATSADIDAK